MTTPTDTGVGGGTGIQQPPTVQKEQSQISGAVKRVAGASSSGITATGNQQVDAFGRPLGGGSQGSFPVGGYTPKQDPKNPEIYMGPSSYYAYMTVNDASNMYYKWDTKTKNKFLSQLQLAGYDTNSLKDAQLQQLWAGYVNVAASYQAAGKSVSPWDALGKDIAQHDTSPRTVTQTQKQYNISTAEDAAALFQGAAQTLLGRDPTQAEQTRFKSVLNKYEQAHPAITTTKSTYSGQDLTNQSSTTSGGVSADTQQYIASEEAKKDPEYGAYQAATNGMNWLLEAIGGA